MELETSIYTLLFEREGKYYLYNSMTNFFCQIANELYSALLEKRFSDIPQDAIKELEHKGVIVQAQYRYDFYYSELLKFNAVNNDQTFMSLVVVPTTQCNFECPYCFEPKKHPKTMSDEVVDQLIAYICKRDKVTHIEITWYGGEPLLAFPIIKNINARLVQEIDKEIVQHSLITNGYLLDPSKIEYFKQIGLNHIQVTLDGLKLRHNTLRYSKNCHNTFDKIITNIDYAVNELVNTYFSIRVNIDKTNYLDFVSLYKYFKDKYSDKENISVYPGLIRRETDDHKSLCNSSYCSRDLIELYRNIGKHGVNTSVFPHKKHKGCMMHAIGAMIVGPEGEIYKCWNDVSDPNKVVGSIFNESNALNTRYIKYAAQTIPFNGECKECIAFPLCDGGCGYQRYRNLFENCKFDLCSPYKDKDKLIDALLNEEI